MKFEIFIAGVNTNAEEIANAALRGAQKRIGGMKTAAGDKKCPVQTTGLDFFESQNLAPTHKVEVTVTEVTKKAAK